MDDQRQYPPIVDRFFLTRFYDLVEKEYPVEVRQRVADLDWQARRTDIDGVCCVCPVMALNYLDGRCSVEELKKNRSPGSSILAFFATRKKTGTVDERRFREAFAYFISAWDGLSVVAKDLPVVLHLPKHAPVEVASNG
jgi:hypothetical protein